MYFTSWYLRMLSQAPKPEKSILIFRKLSRKSKLDLAHRVTLHHLDLTMF